MGKYYSAAADSNAVADANSFALANLDIFSRAEQSAGGTPFSNVRVSDLEPDARPVNTAAGCAERVLLMQLHAAFMG